MKGTGLEPTNPEPEEAVADDVAVASHVANRNSGSGLMSYVKR
jgi:hypothetical protein